MTTEPQTYDATHLTAEHLTDGWTVVDDRGGRWAPNDDAAEQIEAAADPAAAAITICYREPMRGTWTD